VAVATYLLNRSKHKQDKIKDSDKELLNQAKASLEWAYNVLTDNGQTIPPSADRLKWLTCARHIIRYTVIVHNIETDVYKTICSEIEEYWRNKFYTALDQPQLRQAKYYAGGPMYVNIYADSAKIIIGFSKWKKGQDDPLDTEDCRKFISDNYSASPATRGLEEYITNIKDWKSKNIQNYKDFD